MSSVYTYDVDYVQEKLTPPLLRQPIRLDWLKTLTAPIKLKYDDIFGTTESFTGSFSYAKWSAVTAYVKGNRVRYGIAVYEAIIANTNVDPSDTDTWLLIEKDFVGTTERTKFSSQHMVFQYVLNRYLNTTAYTIPQIYTITNSVDSNNFFVGVNSNSAQAQIGYGMNQDDFIGTVYSLNQNAFTVYVPAALFATLGSNATNRENTVRNVVDKYVLAGITYNVTTY